MAGYGDGKKNWVKWVIVYAVVGAIVYALIYYFFLRGPSGVAPGFGY